MNSNGAVQAAAGVIRDAVALIIARFSDADREEVLRFVRRQFEYLNADANEVVSSERIVQCYEAAIPRPCYDGSAISEKIAKLIFRELSKRPSSKPLLYAELQLVFQNATGDSLSQYPENLLETVEHLQKLDYINWQKPGNRPPVIFQGIDFDTWSNEMTEKKDAVRPITYNITGNNARINYHSIDVSTNIVETDENVHAQLDELRRAINAMQLSDYEQKSASDLMDAVDAEFASEKPKKSVVKALLSGLPKAADLAVVVGKIIELIE